MWLRRPSGCWGQTGGDDARVGKQGFPKPNPHLRFKARLVESHTDHSILYRSYSFGWNQYDTGSRNFSFLMAICGVPSQVPWDTEATDRCICLQIYTTSSTKQHRHVKLEPSTSIWPQSPVTIATHIHSDKHALITIQSCAYMHLCPINQRTHNSETCLALQFLATQPHTCLHTYNFQACAVCLIGNTWVAGRGRQGVG